jgi:RHS repeat-associated protein
MTKAHAAGRRTSVSGSLAATDLPAAVASAVYNANNQLTSWAGTALTYDLNGNMTGDGTNTYAWNARDELASISGGASASFVYDGLGRRRGKTVGGVQTGFVYDGENFVEELSGATVTANLVTGGIDELFARKEGSTASYPLTDALGSVIGLTDGSGVLQTQYSYEPYGKGTRSGAGTTNSQTYTGREDDGTGVYYYRARYYSPINSRFIAEDPIGLLDGTDAYSYVHEDPIGLRDPYGLFGWTDMPSFPQPVVDGVAGFGDTLSFGLTFGVRQLIGANAAVDFCSTSYLVGAGAGLAVQVIGFRTGKELKIGRNFRIAPWGNRTGNKFGRWPHYHRRGGPDANGNTPPGKGIGRHRPWENSPHDRGFGDRF